MTGIKFDFSISDKYIKGAEIESMIPMALAAHDMLHSRSAAGNEFLGWMELPLNYDKVEYDRIKRCAWKIRSDSDALVVAGIGGSYLGAKAALDFLGDPFVTALKKVKTGDPAIIFAGNSISSAYHAGLMEYIKDKDVSVNVISKSGTTMEPAIAFRLLKDHMEKKYGKKGASERIYATTDAGKGALIETAGSEGYQTFVIPDDIGGRYSVLSPVGMLPIAVSGADTDAMLAGAAEAVETCSRRDIPDNDCYRYAIARNILYSKGKVIEIMVNYEPSLHYMTEWWKQLFGESEGKDGKGIFPAGADFTTDLHSIGQYIQDGMRNIFETVLSATEQKKNIRIKEDTGNPDGLDYLTGMDLGQINRKAMEATMQAHLEGGVPQLSVTFARQDENSFGQLVYFFEKACALSGYMLGVNPFTQPGVEAYKKKMFALLGKPGYGV